MSEQSLIPWVVAAVGGGGLTAVATAVGSLWTGRHRADVDEVSIAEAVQRIAHQALQEARDARTEADAARRETAELRDQVRALQEERGHWQRVIRGLREHISYLLGVIHSYDPHAHVRDLADEYWA